MPWKRRLGRVLRGQGYTSLIPTMRSHFDEVQVDHRPLKKAGPIVDADLPDADVVVATYWTTAYWVNDLSPSKGAKAYFIQHDERQVGGTDDEVRPTWLMPMYKLLVADWLEPVLRSHGVTHELTVVPNAVDGEQFDAPPRSKQDPPTVGVMYSDSHFKGCDIALEAVRIARQTLPNLKLIAFGKDSPYPDLPLPDGVEYHQDPDQREIAGIYASCDAWLFASRCEGYGLPILEAMACRTPVIATPAGAAPELIRNGGGVLVEPENADSMARAIVSLMGREDSAWRAMSDRAYATARSMNWDEATDRFEAALREARQWTPPDQAASARKVRR
jgi:glycosyltransferase involved in cell wall biosynthesis